MSIVFLLTASIEEGKKLRLVIDLHEVKKFWLNPNFVMKICDL